jgi:hypothetical protein
VLSYHLQNGRIKIEVDRPWDLHKYYCHQNGTELITPSYNTQCNPPLLFRDGITLDRIGESSIPHKWMGNAPMKIFQGDVILRQQFSNSYLVTSSKTPSRPRKEWLNQIKCPSSSMHV